MNEPIADAVRGILDGHIVLDRNLAHRGHYPAIDVLASVSRVMNEIVTDEQKDAAEFLKKQLSVFRDSEDLINIGAYQRSSNAEIDMSLQYIQSITNYTRQKTNEKVNYFEAQERLISEFTGG